MLSNKKYFFLFHSGSRHESGMKEEGESRNLKMDFRLKISGMIERDGFCNTSFSAFPPASGQGLRSILQLCATHRGTNPSLLACDGHPVDFHPLVVAEISRESSPNRVGKLEELLDLKTA
jgi:hypothetical protein